MYERNLTREERRAYIRDTVIMVAILLLALSAESWGDLILGVGA